MEQGSLQCVFVSIEQSNNAACLVLEMLPTSGPCSEKFSGIVHPKICMTRVKGPVPGPDAQQSNEKQGNPCEEDLRHSKSSETVNQNTCAVEASLESWLEASAIFVGQCRSYKSNSAAGYCPSCLLKGRPL